MDDEIDPLLENAASFVIGKQNASISGVQREFRIGYNRAARIIETLELLGLVTHPGEAGNRKVLFNTFDDWWIQVESLSREKHEEPDMTNIIQWPGKNKQ